MCSPVEFSLPCCLDATSDSADGRQATALGRRSLRNRGEAPRGGKGAGSGGGNRLRDSALPDQATEAPTAAPADSSTSVVAVLMVPWSETTVRYQDLTVHAQHCARVLQLDLHPRTSSAEASMEPRAPHRRSHELRFTVPNQMCFSAV